VLCAHILTIASATYREISSSSRWSPDLVVDGDVSQEIIDFLESFSWA
jgi:hypothetical protein